MLLYNNRNYLRLVFSSRGSVLFRAANMIVGIILALACTGIQFVLQMTISPLWVPTTYFSMYSLGGIVTFAVVFRTNLGWQRYWEAIGHLNMMYSKWIDAYSQIVAFSTVSMNAARAKGDDDKDARAKYARVEALLKELEGHFCLISALAVDRLAHGDTRRMEKRSEMVGWSQQIAKRYELRTSDLTGSKQMPEFQVATSPEETAGQLSVRANSWRHVYFVKALPNQFELDALENASDRVNVAMFWIINCLALISKDLDIAPPIQSRMYQELSNGMLGFNQSLKIADVPFPFPYAQLLTLALTAFSLFIPLYVALFTQSVILSPIMAFLLFQGVWGVNEVAKELENPFGDDENDICLADFHDRFVDTVFDVNNANHAHRKARAERQLNQKEKANPELLAAASMEQSKAVPLGVNTSAAAVQTHAEISPLQRPSSEGFGMQSSLPTDDKAVTTVVSSEIITVGELQSDVKRSALNPQEKLIGMCKSSAAFDEHLVQIGNKIVGHLEHIAKELEIGGRVEKQLQMISQQLEVGLCQKHSTATDVAEDEVAASSSVYLPCKDEVCFAPSSRMASRNASRVSRGSRSTTPSTAMNIGGCFDNPEVSKL
eukprot:TRINITY_DN5982_c0_g1_i1.p1 TRINITY_DN5982_c0_g1~~TRINITY_DN5982_c0_g1_i1.p1  ORF type:complete len:604 (-),score=92.81 TRINITY_DN5982_c0_g1_i1:244-2055(-)